MSFNDMVKRQRDKNESLVKNFNGDIRDYVRVGDIYYTSWGYDMTIVQFYEVISLVGKQTAVLRELNANVENDYGRGDGRATPILGSYDGGEFRARATNSYYNESPVAFIVDCRHHAIKWDGEPKYYNTWD